jgi:uncharacterized membrane protein
MVSAFVVTAPPKTNACPIQFTVLPTVMPEASMSVPMNVVLAPSVVAAVGAQKTLQADAPSISETTELATVVRAPFTMKTYAPLPESVIPPVPMEAAPVMQ